MNFSPYILHTPSSKVLDSLSDGQWHAMSKIMSKNNKNFVKNTDGITLEEVVMDMADKRLLKRGHNNSYRLVLPYLEEWRSLRGLELKNQGRLHVPRYFGGILEDDGWEMAPLRTFDVVHFKTGGDVTPRAIQEKVGLRGVVNQDEDGLIRISTLDGQYIYHLIKKWVDEDDLSHIISNVRADSATKKTRRRELSDLPQAFVEDLCVFYGSFAHTLLRKHMSSVKKHITEYDDIQQQIFIWVVNAIQRYDNDKSIPFAAYLSTALKPWVFDLNRKSYGRAAADNELKHSRTIADFESQFERKPSLYELANILGEDIKTTREKAASIDVVRNLRSMATIDSMDYDIPITSSHNHANDMDEEVNQTLMSTALVSVAHEQHNPVGWITLYQQIWGTGKTLTAKDMGITPKTFTLAQEKLKTQLAVKLKELQEVR